jgi:NADH:ubiquinone oxidoreductase subunit E
MTTELPTMEITSQGIKAEIQAVIDRLVEEHRSLPGATMVILNELQTQAGYITADMQAYVAQRLGVPISAVHGVVTFYSFFSTQPRGRHAIKFCTGTACYVGGAGQLIDKARQLTGIDLGQTTADGQITLETCRCVGACSQAPVVVADEDVVGRVRPNKLPQLVRRFQNGDQR